MVLVLQRGLRGEAEQRVALQNRSGVPGENVIIMRAQNLPGSAGRFVYEDFIRWAGGAPAPFVGLRSGDLVTNEDGLGRFFWAERRIGDDTVCVLGVRRVHAAQRLLPGEATVMDILLRNCVRGTAQDAIRPLLEGSVSTQPLPGVSAGETRVLSPLAAPDLR
ncbi:hypothetical protein ACFQXB_10390 [Plastorhodobacter daqingensis]|uniref:Uncharacterized protein n=1 Tax=Plastorhodobacter daqingensis TaxID=1387281 RepID=A0ABW2UKL2_9RHOB